MAVGRTNFPVLTLFLCSVLCFSFSDETEHSNQRPAIPEHLYGQLGLRIMSPLEGEWVHEQSSKALVEVWGPEGYDWGSVVQALVSWQGASAYVPIPLNDWATVEIDPAWSSSPVPIEKSSSITKLVKAESIVQLMPSPDMWDNQPSGQISLVVSASLMRTNCSEGCEILHVVSPFTLVRSWGEVLSEINQNPFLAGSMLGKAATTGRAWPPGGLVIRSPKQEECVEGPTVSLAFSFVGAHFPDDSIEIIMNGKSVERTGIWEREVDLYGLKDGRNCVSLRHVDRNSAPLTSTPSPSTCFHIGKVSSGGTLVCKEASGRSHQQDGNTVLMVTWMPPVHHVTGMSERLWQVAEKILLGGKGVEVASVMCSHNQRDVRAELHPEIRLLACGRELLLPSVIERIALSTASSHVIIASWWFGHPSPRSQPELWIPVLRDYRPDLPVAILVDDLFVPFPYPYNSTVPGDQTTLLAVCGAQTIALAAADAIGTLTQEDATQLRELLPDIPLPIHRVRFSVSGDDESPRASASFEARQPHRRLLYTGSCHAANEAALRWLLEEVMPFFGQELQAKGLNPRDWTLSIVGDITPQTCAPTLCGGGVCEAAHTRGVAVWFEGYVASLDGLMEQSLVFIAPRLAGLGLSTKLMLGLERGLPTVTTPHGTTGYNITDWGGNQGVLVAEHTAPAQFAAAMAMLVSTESRWTIASEGGRLHIANQFRPQQQQADVDQLLQSAALHRQRSMAEA